MQFSVLPPSILELHEGAVDTLSKHAQTFGKSIALQQEQYLKRAGLVGALQSFALQCCNAPLKRTRRLLLTLTVGTTTATTNSLFQTVNSLMCSRLRCIVILLVWQSLQKVFAKYAVSVQTIALQCQYIKRKRFSCYGHVICCVKSKSRHQISCSIGASCESVMDDQEVDPGLTVYRVQWSMKGMLIVSAVGSL